jgi:hypothetical protein
MFLQLARTAPPERDYRHFRVWQRVSIRVQRKVRALASATFFADESRAAADIDLAFTMAVYGSCQPFFGRRPMDFTYDISAIMALSPVLRLIGRSMRANLARISAGFQDPYLKRHFLPVWHGDIVQCVRKKPRTLIELLARESEMVDALIVLGSIRRKSAQKNFRKCIAAVARVSRVDSEALIDLVLRTSAENLVHRGIFEDDDLLPTGSPDAGIGAHEDRDHRCPDSGGQMADPRIVPDIHPGL